MSLRRKIFYAFTLTVVAVLLILPATGWLARLQLMPFATPAATQSVYGMDKSPLDRFDRLSADTIAANGNDFTLRYARAMNTSFEDKDAAESLRRLKELNAESPRNPLVLSAILRQMTRNAVKVQRREENLLSSPARRSEKSYPVIKPSTPAHLSEFIAFAEAGEAVEPANAYFPVMAALGYFASEKDGEAVAAWIRAGEKPEWNEHANDEIIAKWRLLRATNGGNETGAIGRMASMANIPFLQYAGMRSSARMATVMAVQAELRGEKESGFLIRRASRRIGQNMQANCKSLIGNHVGSAIAVLSMSRYGGEEHVSNPYKGGDSSDRWLKERQVGYATYLNAIGHPEEGTLFAAAVREQESIRLLFSRANDGTYWGFEGKTLQLFGAWGANFLLIAGVLFSVAFAGIFKLVYKFSPRLQKGEPLQKSARWGVFLGLAFPLIAGIVSLSAIGLWLDLEVTAWVAFAAGIIAFVVVPIQLRLSRREFGHGLLVMVATWGALTALIGAGMTCVLFAQGVFSALGMIHGLGGENTDKDAMTIVTPWVLGAMVLSVPLGLLSLFGIFSKILRVPFAAGVTRGMRAMAVPLACVLTLAWGGVLLYTLGHEQAAIAEMEQMASMGEMQFLRTIDVNLSKK